MSKPDKPREEPRIRVEDLEKEANSIYKKQWPKDEAIDEPQDDESKGGVAGVLDHPSYKELEQKLTDMEEKANDYWNQQLRAQAELDNVRRRAEREVSNAHKYALEKFVNDLLPVVDSLERGLLSDVAQNELAQKIKEGLELTQSMFLKTLEKFGVKQIDPKGQAFNPELQQAISTQPSAEVPPNHVIEVLQKGYTLNDRLIRPAMVIVASKG